MPLREEQESEDHWISVSDMMAGLMIVFMLLSIIFIRTVVEREEVYRQECDKIYRDLQAEFKHDLPIWKAELDKDLSVRFSNPEVLFQPAKSEIRPKFIEILNSFFPRYMKKASKYRQEISEIRIEGHTSSDWLNVRDKEAYFKNMALSQSRTRAILEYVLNLPEAKDYGWAQHKLTANGLSSSRLIRNEYGREDRKRSRRVEFRILASSCQKAEG